VGTSEQISEKRDEMMDEILQTLQSLYQSGFNDGFAAGQKMNPEPILLTPSSCRDAEPGPAAESSIQPAPAVPEIITPTVTPGPIESEIARIFRPAAQEAEHERMLNYRHKLKEPGLAMCGGAVHPGIEVTEGNRVNCPGCLDAIEKK
jgi:hypothetical protein